MPSSTHIDPKHILILGAGPGLSASIARRFGREGFAVTLVARREQALAELADQLGVDGITVHTATADASDSRGFRAALEGLAERITPGVVIYNAAVIASDNVLEVDEDYVLSTYTVDVVGAISAAQVFTPAMRDAKAGTFLASGGVAAVDPQPPYASLALGKAGLRTTATLLHRQLKDEGVHVASVTIYGPIAPNTHTSPELIAERYWELHAQPASDWTDESVFDGK
jgi:short-subunit dehydrogenase